MFLRGVLDRILAMPDLAGLPSVREAERSMPKQVVPLAPRGKKRQVRVFDICDVRSLIFSPENAFSFRGQISLWIVWKSVFFMQYFGRGRGIDARADRYGRTSAYIHGVCAQYIVEGQISIVQTGKCATRIRGKPTRGRERLQRQRLCRARMEEKFPRFYLVLLQFPSLL
jgi:hypothetical protein